MFAGTLVVSGQGLLQVSALGRHTELGRIGHSLDTIALQASPLREEMARLTRKLVAIGLSLCALLVALFWALRGDWLQAVLAGITLAMGVLPQELPVIMIIFLALAARCTWRTHRRTAALRPARHRLRHLLQRSRPLPSRQR